MVSNYKQIGQTSLMCAVFKGHVDCVRLLIESGADVDATDNVRLLLCFVARVYGLDGLTDRSIVDERTRMGL
jgi:hypothetical protein